MRFRDFTATPPSHAPVDAAVRIDPLWPDRPGPIAIEPAEPGLDLAEWARRARSVIDERLHQAGAVLFRQFALTDVADFERAVRSLARSGELMTYVENTSPRTTVHGQVKTSTDHPADQEIVLHNEHSFSEVFPSRLFLHCRRAPAQGGETPLADCRRIVTRLSRAVRDRFQRKGGYLYVRNFGDGFGPHWSTVFQTHDRATLERHLTTHDIEFAWRDGDRLRIRYRRPTEVRHPITRERAWFNHVLFWHVSSLEASVQDVLQRSFAEEDLPNQVFYGDGDTIEPDVIAEIRQAYADETWQTPWQVGDVLLVDNVLLAHGRRPYVGDRLILFAMADPVVRADVTAEDPA